MLALRTFCVAAAETVLLIILNAFEAEDDFAVGALFRLNRDPLADEAFDERH